jgi:methylmalonyl-CoA mutase N-terminal domain/subunit
VIVGVNRYVEDSAEPTEVFPIDPALQADQVARVRRTRAERDAAGVEAALADLATAARGSANLLYPMKVALARRATLGEVSDVLRAEFGVYSPER